MERTSGFRENILKKSGDVGLIFDFVVNVIGKYYEVRARRMLISIFLVGISIALTTMFLIVNYKLALYIGIGVILGLVAVAVLVFLFVLTDPVSGSLIHNARILSRYKKRRRRVAKGLESPWTDTGDGYVDEDGYIFRKNGDVGKIIIVDGYTSPMALQKDVKTQQVATTNWQRVRLPNVGEVKITTVEPQNTDLQIREQKRRVRGSDNQAIKDFCGLQVEYLRDVIAQNTTTVVQYILAVADSKSLLSKYLNLMAKEVNDGLYYNISPLNKAETEALLNDIRHLL